MKNYCLIITAGPEQEIHPDFSFTLIGAKARSDEFKARNLSWSWVVSFHEQGGPRYYAISEHDYERDLLFEPEGEPRMWAASLPLYTELGELHALRFRVNDDGWRPGNSLWPEMIQSYESGPHRESDFLVLRNYRGQLVTHNRKTGISMLGIRLFMDQSLQATYEVDQWRPYAFYEDPGAFDFTLPLKRILEREETLAPAKRIDPVSLDDVVLGSVVHLRTTNNYELMYTLVGPDDADPKSGLLSSDSLIGKALLGHREGETVTVKTAGGVKEYTIVSIDGTISDSSP